MLQFYRTTIIAFFIFLVSSSEVHANESRWLQRRFGGGQAPDTLFVLGEYKLNNSDQNILSSVAVVTPSLTNFAFFNEFKFYEFLSAMIWAGRNQYYRSLKGTGLISLSEANMGGSRTQLLDADRGGAAGEWLAGARITIYWSTLKLFENVYEGFLKLNTRLVWIDSVEGNYFCDPVPAAVISRRESMSDVQFFASLRLNKEEKRAKRVGLLSETTWFQTNGVVKKYISPAVQWQFSDSNWELFATMPIKLDNPYDERSVGFFISVNYQ